MLACYINLPVSNKHAVIKALRQLFPGCQVPIFSFFSYFLSLYLFSPILKLKPPIFRIFFASEAKICNRIEKGIIVVCVFERDLS